MAIKPRMNIKDLEPDAYPAMMGLENYVRSTALSARHKELIKIRASQINSCAYCIAMHTEEARSLGETEERIYALSAWRESPLFSEEERALLALTEEVTLIANGGLKEETFQHARQYFDDKTIAQIIMQIVTINAWNRIAVSSHSIYEKQMRAA